MGKRHVSSELERTAMVLYVPAAGSFWTSKKRPPDRLRKAKVFYGRLPPPPAGTVYMLVRKARSMLNRNDHDRFLAYVEPEDRDFFERFALPA